jgi:hypothetical protein
MAAAIGERCRRKIEDDGNSSAERDPSPTKSVARHQRETAITLGEKADRSQIHNALKQVNKVK